MFITACLNGTLWVLPPPCLNRRPLTRVLRHCEHVLRSFQRHELGLGERYPVAMALGHPGQIVNRCLPGLSAMADREIQGMKVGVLAHTLPALLGGERGQEEGHRLPALLGHDGGPGRRAVYVAVLLTPVLATRMAGVKGLQPRFEEGAFFGGLEAVGGQDRELVTTVLLAQTSNEV